MIAVLGAEEANLLRARQLGRQNGWWNPVIGSMQGSCVQFYLEGISLLQRIGDRNGEGTAAYNLGHAEH